MPVKYFYRGRYRASSVSAQEFYEGLEREVLGRGLVKIGVQMGLGLTFKAPKE